LRVTEAMRSPDIGDGVGCSGDDFRHSGQFGGRPMRGNADAMHPVLSLGREERR
jgi:hypothetical protein